MSSALASINPCRKRSPQELKLRAIAPITVASRPGVTSAEQQIWFVPWWLVIGAVAFAIVVSLLSGLYPASRAAQLDPVQALRYE